ncbi:MAG: GNAT family N-acetyltransferase [Bacteroidota bacterium]|nr:GNAT family N-acetyltransferase [Bacteroidota bacterium]
MIKHLEQKEIDRIKWDKCMSESPNACMFAYTWYLDIVCEGWAGLVLNDYEAVFPIARKSKFKISYIFQPFFTRYFGVFSHEKNPADVKEFLAAIPPEYKYMEFCLHESNELTDSDFQIRERKYQSLDLSPSLQEIQSSYSDNTKRSIKKALKAGFILQNSARPEVIVNLFRENKGAELEEFKPGDYQTLARLMKEFSKQENAETFCVRDQENNVCAAAFFMKNKDRFVYLKSGQSEAGRASGAMHLLVDGMIRKHAGTNKILDFGGSSVETVARFYKSFGAKDCVYLQVKKDRLSRIAKLIRSLKS